MTRQQAYRPSGLKQEGKSWRHGFIDPIAQACRVGLFATLPACGQPITLMVGH